MPTTSQNTQFPILIYKMVLSLWFGSSLCACKLHTSKAQLLFGGMMMY